VRTPPTVSSSTSKASAGNPVNTLTPSPSACSPSQRTTSQIEAIRLPWLRISGGVGNRIEPFSRNQ
jgi:hypothetical protein